MSRAEHRLVPDPAPPFDVPALEAWLRERLPGFDGTRGISRFTGGQSIAYFLMSCHMPPAGMRGLAGRDLAALGIPDEAACIASYERHIGRRVTGKWNFYLSYNVFRLAGIVQRIVKPAELGTASNAQAKEYGALLRPLAELGWNFAERVH